MSMENNKKNDNGIRDILSSLSPDYKQRILTLIKKKNDELKEYKDKYKLFLENLNEGVFLENINGHFTFVNPRAAAILRYSELELLGMHKNSILPSEELAKFEKVSVKHQKESNYSFQCNLLAKDGSRVPVSLTTISIISKSLKFEGRIIIFTNLSEHKKTEEDLQRTEERYRKLVDLSPDAIIMLDLNAKITFLSEQALILYGYDNDNELNGKSFYDLILSTDHPRVLKNMKKTIQFSAVKEIEYIMIRKDKTNFNAEISTSLLTDEINHPSSYIIVARDITERKKALEKQEELAEKRKDFMTKTAHELRTPITIIKGYTEFLMKQEENERKKYYLDVIMKNLLRLEDLSSDVSDLFRLERGMFEINLEKMDITEFLVTFVEPYIRLYQGQVHWINLNVREKIMIIGDSERLKNVFSNVLENALRHSNSKTRNIAVELNVSDIEVQIVITDNGAGIEPENLEKIFEKFVSFPTDYCVIGTGIGLFISSEIMSLHNGTIYAYSEGKGTGTTITIVLPRFHE